MSRKISSQCPSDIAEFQNVDKVCEWMDIAICRTSWQRLWLPQAAPSVHKSLNTLRRIIPLMIWLSLGALLAVHQGIATLLFFMMFSLVLVLVDYLCRLIIRHRLRIPGSLVIGLLVSTTLIVLSLFTFVKGVDAVDVTRSWIGYIMLTYLCAVYVFGVRLSERLKYKHNPPQPPPKASAI
jgi:hypothetical protein